MSAGTPEPEPPSASPRISVVVPSHDRPLRLRWLLNALEEQTLPPGEWEIVVAHDSRGPETEALLREHPLARAGRLRHVTLPAGSAPPGANRNAAWRLARAAVIAFTDDDCRPPSGWLAAALAAAERLGAEDPAGAANVIVQGRTRPDPDELSVALHSPHARSQTIDPPVPWAQTCNIIYPRSLLERLGGFDEEMAGGEDCDLAQRALAAGAELHGAPEVLTYHAVSAPGLIGALKSLPRWQHLAGLVKRHPGVRSSFTLHLFWRETHPLLLIGLGGLCVAFGPGRRRRRRLAGLAIVPWALRAAPSYGSSWRGRARAASELPGRAVVDLAEIAVLARGSVRYRTLLL